MKESEDQLNDAILIVAASLGYRKQFITLLRVGDINRTIKSLIYYVFVMNKFNHNEDDVNVFQAIELIWKYVNEFEANMSVKFNETELK